MKSNVMDKFNELLAEGAQREEEDSSTTIDTMWFGLLVAQSQIIVLLEDIRKMMSAYMLNRFNRIDISEESEE